MNKRYLTAAVLIAIVFPVLYFGGYPLYILMVLFGCLICYEMNNISTKEWPALARILTYPLLLFCMFSTFISPEMLIVASSVSLMYLFFLLIWYEKVTFEQIGLWYLFLNLIGIMCGGIRILYQLHPLGMFFMLAGTVIPDAGAYFVGRAMGKHKLNFRISPNKTIEGSVGGYLTGLAATLACGLTLFRPVYEQYPAFIIAGCVLMPLVGQIGDLAFSAIKRHYKIKDFSNVFPGHGGGLDRLDSISFNCVLLYILFILLVK